MKIAWATDIHLNFLDADGLVAFHDALRSAVAEGAGGVVLTGDLAEADSLELYLLSLEAAIDVPIWFVLGNHDFYGGSVRIVRDQMMVLGREHPRLRWLPTTGVVPLGDDAALVGHDGWGDARAGDWDASTVFLNDYRLIQELVTPDKAERARLLRSLGDEAAAYLDSVLAVALPRYRHVVVATHVPPFREACWHEGRISDDDWLPHFTCVAVGDVLRRHMLAHPDRRMTVLCGHTHGAGVAAILPNLEVRTGGADYGHPELQAPLLV